MWGKEPNNMITELRHFQATKSLKIYLPITSEIYLRMCSTKRKWVTKKKGRYATQETGDPTQERGHRHSQLSIRRSKDAGNVLREGPVETKMLESARRDGAKKRIKSISLWCIWKYWEEVGTSGGEFRDELVTIHRTVSKQNCGGWGGQRGSRRGDQEEEEKERKWMINPKRKKFIKKYKSQNPTEISNKQKLSYNKVQ